MNRSTLFVNPAIATNSVDPEQAGWYLENLNSGNLALRVTASNIELPGEIRFTYAGPTGIFQGYDGSDWVDFNATQGATGPKGDDFLNVVNFNNIDPSMDSSSTVTYGEIFKTASINAALGVSNVDIRILKGGVVEVNQEDLESLVISQNSNVVTLTSQALPFNWNFSSNNTVTYNKSLSGDTIFKAYGDVSKWIVKSTSSVSKGTVVRVTREATNSNIVITPLTYSTTNELNCFSYPVIPLGIALEDAVGGATCNVCTKGVTTVLCTNTSVTAQFISTTSVSDIGLPGLVGTNGAIFCNTGQPITDKYVKIGYFLEQGGSVAADGAYSLFYVDPKTSL